MGLNKSIITIETDFNKLIQQFTDPVKINLVELLFLQLFVWLTWSSFSSVIVFGSEFLVTRTEILLNP